MINIVAQLRSERKRVAQQLGRLDAALSALSGARLGGNSLRPHRRRKMSAQARKRIAAAQRARWAVWKAKQSKAA
jgi:hypothetical protein